MPKPKFSTLCVCALGEGKGKKCVHRYGVMVHMEVLTMFAFPTNRASDLVCSFFPPSLLFLSGAAATTGKQSGHYVKPVLRRVC